ERTASGRRAIRLAHAVGSDCAADFKLRLLVTPHDATIEFSVYVEQLDVPSRISFAVAGKPAVNWTRGEKGLTRAGSDDPPIRPGVWTKVAVPATAFGLKPGDRISGVSLSQAGGIVLWDAATISGKLNPAQDPGESLAAWRALTGTTTPPEI